MQFAVVRRFEVQRIDPEIVPSVHNAVERLVIREVKRCFRDKEEERYRAFPLLVGAGTKRIAQSIGALLDNAGHLLVNNLRSERHR